MTQHTGAPEPPPPYTPGIWSEGDGPRNCPCCGADLGLAPAPQPGDLRTAASLVPPDTSPNVGYSQESDTDSFRLRRLKQLICAPNTYLYGGTKKKRPRTMRPDLAEANANANADADTAKSNPVNETLTQVANTMQVAIRRAGEQSTDTLLESRRGGRDKYDLPGRMERVLEAVGAILYDHTWTSRALTVQEPIPRDGKPAYYSQDSGLYVSIAYVLEHMLLVDYKFPPSPIRAPRILGRDYFLRSIWPDFENFSAFLTKAVARWAKGELPDSKDWDHITRRMGKFETASVEVWDAAILLYYYNTRRESVDPELHKQGWSEYTGVLQEMLDEVPARGIGRLERKLSLDVHVLIPKFISGRQRREEMISMAEDIARQHGCQLAPRRVPVWRRCLHGIFGWFLPIDMQKLKDEEHGVGKGVKKEEERSAQGNGDGKRERGGDN